MSNIIMNQNNLRRSFFVSELEHFCISSSRRSRGNATAFSFNLECELMIFCTKKHSKYTPWLFYSMIVYSHLYQWHHFRYQWHRHRCWLHRTYQQVGWAHFFHAGANLAVCLFPWPRTRTMASRVKYDPAGKPREDEGVKVQDIFDHTI